MEDQSPFSTPSSYVIPNFPSNPNLEIPFEIYQPSPHISSPLDNLSPSLEPISSYVGPSSLQPSSPCPSSHTQAYPSPFA